MSPASPGTSALFAVLVLTMVGLTCITLYLRGGDRSFGARVGPVVVLVRAYLIVPGVLALSGVLNQYEPVPRPIVLVVALTALTLRVAFSPFGARLASSLSLASLVGFQFFRVPVELVLHRLAVEAVIPYVMTYVGWNFDILTGFSAAVLGFLLARRSIPRTVLLMWNVAGLLLLANIVAIAALAAPVPFQFFTDGPSNTLPSSFPYVWLPTVLVQLALFGHLLLFRRLRVIAAD